MIKKILTYALAAAAALSALTITAQADGSATTVITAECRRIEKDNSYFEISLNANTQEKELSAISMVLEYDAKLLKPVMWDGTELDMTTAKSWKARQAMPTLSLDTWTAGTAFTYIDSETDKGYLFLSAEYPGPVAEKAADPGGGGEPETPARDVGQTVVARFAYIDENSQQTIVDNWDTSPAVKLASDAVALESPSQYPVGIYYADGTYKAFAVDFEAAKLETDNQASASDFDIQLTLGVSAKTKSLTLNDVSAIMFYDWDDSFLGAVTVMRGDDAREQINGYVDSTFIHTDLQGQKGETLASKARKDNYRGEYPSIEPHKDQTDSVKRDNGASYPLTNKLDYIFYGKTIDPEYPYVSGWKQVEPLTMTDEWTALSADDLAVPESGSDDGSDPDPGGGSDPGTDPDSGTPEPEENTKLKTYDFSVINDRVIYVKAMYAPGEGLDKTPTGDTFVYYTVSEPEFLSLDNADTENGTYAINITIKRINQFGYGVTRLLQPVVRMGITPYTDMDAGTVGPELTMQAAVDKSDTASTQLTPVRRVANMTYQLLDLENNKYNVVTGQVRSTVGSSSSLSSNGFIYYGTLNKIINALENYAKDDTEAWDNIDFQAAKDALLRQKATTEFKKTTWNSAKKKIAPLAAEWLQTDGKITWEHIQYSILNKYNTADYATCKNFFQSIDWR